jgi:hypothetical protein
MLRRWLRAASPLPALNWPGVCFHRDDLRFGGGFPQKQLAGVYVIPRLCGEMLGCYVEVAHASLQWRGLIKRDAAGQGKAVIGDTILSPTICLEYLKYPSGIRRPHGKIDESSLQSCQILEQDRKFWRLAKNNMLSSMLETIRAIIS